MRTSLVVAGLLLAFAAVPAFAAQSGVVTNAAGPEQLHGIVVSLAGNVLTLRLRNGQTENVDIGPRKRPTTPACCQGWCSGRLRQPRRRRDVPRRVDRPQQSEREGLVARQLAPGGDEVKWCVRAFQDDRTRELADHEKRQDDERRRAEDTRRSCRAPASGQGRENCCRDG